MQLRSFFPPLLTLLLACSSAGAADNGNDTELANFKIPGGVSVVLDVSSTVDATTTELAVGPGLVWSTHVGETPLELGVSTLKGWNGDSEGVNSLIKVKWELGL